MRRQYHCLAVNMATREDRPGTHGNGVVLIVQIGHGHILVLLLAGHCREHGARTRRKYMIYLCPCESDVEDGAAWALFLVGGWRVGAARLRLGLRSSSSLGRGSSGARNEGRDSGKTKAMAGEGGMLEVKYDAG